MNHDDDDCAAEADSFAREQTTRRLIVVAAALCTIALVAAVFVGCDRASQRDRDVRQACITAGGSWLGGDTDSEGHCIRTGGDVR